MPISLPLLACILSALRVIFLKALIYCMFTQVEFVLKDVNLQLLG